MEALRRVARSAGPMAWHDLPRRIAYAPSALMLLTLALGFALGWRFEGMSVAAMGALASLMTFSLADVPFRSIRAGLRFAPLALVLSFLLHPALLLLAGLLTSPALWQGWVILAAVPPAISVIPFAAILRGNVKVAVTSNAVLYLASLALTPAVALLLLGVAVSPAALFLSVLVLILLPVVLSRGVPRLPLSNRGVELARNLSFGALTFLIGAANRGVVLDNPSLALEALGASLLVVGVASGLTWLLLRRVDGPTRTTMVLFSGYKNSGLAATLALALLVPAAVVAPTMMIVFQILWIALLARVRTGSWGA